MSRGCRWSKAPRATSRRRVSGETHSGKRRLRFAPVPVGAGVGERRTSRRRTLVHPLARRGAGVERVPSDDGAFSSRASLSAAGKSSAISIIPTCRRSKSVLSENRPRPRKRARDDDHFLAFHQTLDRVFQRCEPGGVDHRDLSEVKDERVKCVAVAGVKGFHGLLRRAEKERSVDFVEDHARRQPKHASVPRGVQLDLRLGKLDHAPHRTEGPQDEADGDAMTMSKKTVSRKQVTRTRTSLSGATFGRVPVKCCTSDMFHATAGGGPQATPWDVGDEGARHENRRRTHDRMGARRQRGPGACADVRRGARKGTGRGNPPEQRREDVADPEGDQLRVGARASSPSSRPRSTAEQEGLDGPEHRDGEGGREKGTERAEVRPQDSPREAPATG